MKEESEDHAKKSAEFKRWLALYFIDKGNWKLTDKAIEEFGIDATPKQTMEFAEHYTSREREERTEYRVGLTPKEKKKIAHMKVADMVDKGKTEELYDNGYITGSRTRNWKDKSSRITVIRKLVELLNKDPRDLMQEDFKSNRLGGLLNYHSCSPYEAVKEVFPGMGIKPWEMPVTPRGFFDDKNNRINAVKWLIKKLKKNPCDLTKEDFHGGRLGGLLHSYYNNSPYEAVKEAFSEMDIKPWEMAVTPMRFYNTKKNRIAAVKWLVKKLGKDPRDLMQKDFYDNRLWRLITYYYNGSPYEAVKETFPELDIKPWEMLVTPRDFFDIKENRIAAVKWLVDKLGKEPRDLIKGNFHNNRLGGLFHHYYNGSTHEAVKEAFPEMDIKPWEMQKAPQGFYKKKENRIAAVKWLVERLGKDPSDLTVEDFNNNRLAGLLHNYYNVSPYEAVKEAGLVSGADKNYMRRYGGARFQDTLSSKEAREAARKIERKAAKKLPKRMVKGKRRLT